MFSRLYLYFLLYIFTWSVSSTEFEEDFCDEPSLIIYCSCDVNYRQTTVTCFINGNVTKSDAVWKKMSKVDNVYSVKIMTRDSALFEEIPIKSLTSLPYLEMLTVAQAKLGDLQPHAISELKVLRELDLKDCGITSLQNKAISKMPKLKMITLSDNLLQELLSESLTGLDDLEHLFLERNQISRIAPCAFCDLQNLRELDLWQNEITDITEYMFRGLRYLKRLDLSQNKISILNDKIFHSMPKLEELQLQGNEIHYVNDRTFQGLQKLHRISLRSNKIKLLPNKVFKSLPNLRTVDLCDNQLETFPVQILNHMDNVKHPHFMLDFAKNPLVCDCRLYWVKEYMQMNTSRFFTDFLRELGCQDGNVTQTVHQMNCTKPAVHHHQKKMPPTSRAVVIDLVPHEMQKPKNNKTLMVEDVTVEDFIISQDSEVDLPEKIQVDESESSAARSISIDVHLLVFTTLVTVFLVRRRKGTC